MKLPKWLICKATLIEHYHGGACYFKYGWRIVGLFIESNKRDVIDSKYNKDEKKIHRFHPPPFRYF
jgi:hypothetical protein